MHSIEELGTNVPAFLAKLWKMVEDPQTNDLISWSSAGTSFYIHDQARFARELLPLYYKHNNMASFVRQLNMYGFHKVVSIESGGLKVDKDEMEFAHQYFLMGRPYLLEHIKRKIPINKAEDARSGSKPELVNKVLSEVKNMKGRQDSLDTQLTAMKRENEVLWREVAILRQKHMKQQQIVNKLIQFLVSMVQSSRSGGIGVKRHYPLMLSDITNRPNKSPKLSDDSSEINSVTNNLSPTGPVIHELDPTELLDDCGTATDEVSGTYFLTANAEIGEVHSPVSPADSSLNAKNTPLEEAAPDVLLEFADDYPLNPEILISVSGVDNMSATASKMQKQKTKLDSSKPKKRKLKLFSNLKNKPTSVKKPQLDDSITLEKVASELCSNEYEIAGKNISNGTVDDVEVSLVAANDAAISAISNAAATVTEPKTEINPLETSNCKKSASNDSLNDGKVPTSASDQGSNMTLACSGNNIIDSLINREELDSHLDTMQSDLDGLKELLKGDSYSLDANTLLGVRQAVFGIEKDALLKLFGGDDLLSYGIHLASGPEGEQKRKDNNVSDPLVSGSELMAYPADILDFSDMCQSSEEEWILPGSPPAFSLNDGSQSYNNASTDLSTPSPHNFNSPKVSQ